MRNYEVECQDPRDDMCINIFNIKADLFTVDDTHTTVMFFSKEEHIGDGMIPVAMFPFKYLVSVTTNDAVEE